MSLYQKIVDTYRIHKTIRMTAIKCGCSRTIVRRVIITEGLLVTPRIEKIKEMLSEGMEIEEIAKRLNCSEETIREYSPYRRGCRVDLPVTKNALRIRACRERKKRNPSEKN